jgi:hypothetical protein
MAGMPFLSCIEKGSLLAAKVVQGYGALIEI